MRNKRGRQCLLRAEGYLSRFLISIINYTVLPCVNAQFCTNQQFLGHLGQARSIQKLPSVLDVIHLNSVVLEIMHELILAPNFFPEIFISSKPSNERLPSFFEGEMKAQ